MALAKRACTAKLRWENQELMVEAEASEVDLDAFGIDLGDGVPIAAFQIKKSDTDCCMEYRIFAIDKTPRLLRRITGGGYFSASDVDLEGRPEIWTDDSIAVNGFESLTLSELDTPPSVAFRFAHGQLTDVSTEFQHYYDQQIGRLQAAIAAPDLEEFKNSDGRLAQKSAAVTPSDLDRIHRLRGVKVKILEIVWAYLYSGREQEAWLQLSQMWPAGDVDRIRAAIVKARAAGVHGQADSSSTGPPRKKKRVPVYDASNPRSGMDSQPTGILLEFQLPAEQQSALPPEVRLDLIIDSAGKVRSVHTPLGSPEWLSTVTSTWKFIPGFKEGKPVACRQRMSVAPRR